MVLSLLDVREVRLLSVEPDFTGVLFYEDALARVKAEVPVDGREIVDWMQECEAANMVLYTFSLSYSRAGGLFDHTTGDGYIPGVRYEGYSFVSDRGTVVSQRGYAVVVPGNHRVPVGSWAWIDPLRVLAAVGRVGVYQYNALLAVFRRYASIPVRERIVFPRVWGMTLPLVFRQSFIAPTPLAVYRVVVSSDRATTIDINFYTSGRSPYASNTVEVRRGQSEIVLVLLMPQSGYIEFRPRGDTVVSIDQIERMPPV